MNNNDTHHLACVSNDDLTRTVAGAVRAALDAAGLSDGPEPEEELYTRVASKDQADEVLALERRVEHLREALTSVLLHTTGVANFSKRYVAGVVGSALEEDDDER